MVGIMDNIHYLDWTLDVRRVNDDGQYSLRWTFKDDQGPQLCRAWLIDGKTATISDFVQTALRAALDAQEHEVREKFTYKGKKIYGPHFSPDALVELATYRKNLSLPNEAR